MLKKLQTPASARRVIRPAVRAAGGVVRDAARQFLPSNYTGLKKSIAVKVAKSRDPFSATAVIGPRSDYYYAFLGPIVEFGTLGSRKVPLSPKTKRKNKSNPLPTGMRPRPFMRYGFDQTKHLQLQVMVAKLRERLAVELGKQK